MAVARPRAKVCGDGYHGELRGERPDPEAMANRGDPRVHFVINLVLSASFAALILWGLEFIGAGELTVGRFLVGTVALMAVTYLVTR